MTPFQALYGYSPNHMSIGPYLEANKSEVTDLLENRNLATALIKENLQKAQHRMKFFADQHRQERSFQVGDFVFLKLQPFRQNSVSLRRNLKLSFKYFGPYQVLEKVGSVAYKLDLPEGSKIHPVFHVSLLKKYIGKLIVPSTELPPVGEDGTFSIFPVSVLEHREVPSHPGMKAQIKVSWVNNSWGISFWEDVTYLLTHFSEKHPWEQGSLVPPGIVMDQVPERLVEGIGIEKSCVEMKVDQIGSSVSEASVIEATGFGLKMNGFVKIEEEGQLNLGQIANGPK